ncbi:MAG: hypothetical protein WDN04_03170 [Rhodospirillales bacterium]
MSAPHGRHGRNSVAAFQALHIGAKAPPPRPHIRGPAPYRRKIHCMPRCHVQIGTVQNSAAPDLDHDFTHARHGLIGNAKRKRLAGAFKNGDLSCVQPRR